MFLDGPAGTQAPERCIDAIVHYLSTCNANQGGAFATSEESDRILHKAHAGMAALLNATSAEEIVFGPNMTALTFHLSRSIGKTLGPGDEVIVTRLDHDANIRPWVLAAEDAGATVRWADIRPEDCTLDMDGLGELIGDKTRLIAVTCASNLVGTVVDVATICRWAHDAGALVFLDAVHYAPHRTIDVQQWGCDFLACSAYKFFGPHVGVLWGRRQLLEELPAYKVRPAPDEPPGRWMTGTQNHEGLAGLTGTLDYLGSIGGEYGITKDSLTSPTRSDLQMAFSRIQAYESKLVRRLLHGLADRPKFHTWGVCDPQQVERRAPTVAITHVEKSAAELARRLAAEHIFCWAGNSYAVELTQRLGLDERGGVLRLGAVHYNTEEEIDFVLSVLDKI